MPKQAYEETNVPVTRSKEQIEKLLKRFQVEAVRFTSYPAYATLEFVRHPAKDHYIPYRVTVKPKVNYTRNAAAELDRAERQVWRVVYWWLKSKLEAIEFGLVEFEQEMLPYMLLHASDGRSETAATLFFERLAGQTALPSDPFDGLRPALPPPRGEKP